jgi:hypothetical protein
MLCRWNIDFVMKRTQIHRVGRKPVFLALLDVERVVITEYTGG